MEVFKIPIKLFLEASPISKILFSACYLLLNSAVALQLSGLNDPAPLWEKFISCVVIFGLISILLIGILWAETKGSEVFGNMHPEASTFITRTIVRIALLFGIYSSITIILRELAKR